MSDNKVSLPLIVGIVAVLVAAGGGFYYLEKYKVAPKTITKHLHGFKYEAYLTWL